MPFSRGNNSSTGMVASTDMRFNGATAFQPWKPGGDGQRGVQSGGASMGPRPFSRGNLPLHVRDALPSSRFNGATAFQPWKLPIIVNGKKWSPGFNGATAFQPWKHGVQAEDMYPHCRLQWGHGLSAVETRMAGRNDRWAKMLQWGYIASAWTPCFHG